MKEDLQLKDDLRILPNLSFGQVQRLHQHQNTKSRDFLNKVRDFQST